MADAELDNLVRKIKNGSPFESLRAANELATLVERQQQESASLRESADGDLAKLVESVRSRGGLDRLADLVETARRTESGD
jgi:hypothetical protein